MSNYNLTLQSNNTDLQAILNTINELPEASGVQATPVISVGSNGLITATAGTKTSTYQLAFQAAKTITPSTASQIAVSSGYYTGGNITVAGDANLVAGNIKNGVSIFGITGTLSDGGSTDIENSIIAGTLTSYVNNVVSSIRTYAFYNYKRLTTARFTAATSIGDNAFQACDKLTTISFPACRIIGAEAFSYCSQLTTISFPACRIIGVSAFNTCPKLTTVSFPACEIICSDAFQYCTSLTTASFPVCTSISVDAFRNCYRLTAIYLTNSSVCKLDASDAFSGTPIGGFSTTAGTYGSIYVPASLLTFYQKATNWTYFSSRFVGI